MNAGAVSGSKNHQNNSTGRELIIANRPLAGIKVIDLTGVQAGK
jgi:hypothetical protein